MDISFTAGIFLTAAILASEPSEEGREAARYSSIATYRQSGIDKIVEPKIQYLHDKYIPQEIKNLGVGPVFAYRLFIDRKIEFSWGF